MLYLLYVQPYSSQIISTQRTSKSSSTIRSANSPCSCSFCSSYSSSYPEDPV